MFAFTSTGRRSLSATLRSKGIAATSKALVRAGDEYNGGRGGLFKSRAKQQCSHLEEN